VGKMLPSLRMLLWGTVFGLLAIYAYNKSETLKRILA